MAQFKTKYGTYQTAHLYVSAYPRLMMRVTALAKTLDIPLSHIMFAALDVVLPMFEAELPKRRRFVVQVGVDGETLEKVEVNINYDRKTKTEAGRKKVSGVEKTSTPV